MDFVYFYGRHVTFSGPCDCFCVLRHLFLWSCDFIRIWADTCQAVSAVFPATSNISRHPEHVDFVVRAMERPRFGSVAGSVFAPGPKVP